MKNVAEWVVWGFFGAIVVAIVFVKAGASGQTGGAQTAEIIKAGSSGLSGVATALEG